MRTMQLDLFGVKWRMSTVPDFVASILLALRASSELLGTMAKEKRSAKKKALYKEFFDPSSSAPELASAEARQYTRLRCSAVRLQAAGVSTGR